MISHLFDLRILLTSEIQVSTDMSLTESHENKPFIREKRASEFSHMVLGQKINIYKKTENPQHFNQYLKNSDRKVASQKKIPILKCRLKTLSISNKLSSFDWLTETTASS